MSYPFSEFYDYIQDEKFNRLIVLDYGNEIDVIDVIKLLPTRNLNNKNLRLALDIINEIYPLYKNMCISDKAEFLKDIFQADIPIERLRRLNPFKRIIFRNVISLDKNNQIIIKRVRKQ